MGLFCRFQLELQQFCVKPFVGHANLIRCRYWRLEERRDGAVSRVVFFCAVYIVLLGQCYVAMPSGYKLVITRALGLHGIYCTQPSGLAPSCFSAIYSIHPSCPCYNYNLLKTELATYTCTILLAYQVIVKGLVQDPMVTDGATPCSCGVERRFILLQ